MSGAPIAPTAGGRAASARSRGGAVLALAGLLFLAQFAVYFNFTEDDPGISFRYAWNLAHGQGLVYNPGERVEGYSNFGWVVAVAALFRTGLLADRLAVVPVFKAVNAAFALACLLLFYRQVRRDGGLGARPAAAAVVLFAGAGGLALAAASGLETVTLTLLLLVAAGATLRHLDHPAPGPGRCLGLAAVLSLLAVWRIDAPWLVALLGVFVLAVRRGRPTRADLAVAGLVAASYAAYTAFRLATFGALLPNTFHAKVSLDPSLLGGWGYVGAFLRGHGGVVAVLAVVLAGMTVRSRLARLAGVLFLGQALYVAVVQGDWMPGFRFFTPVLPSLAVLAAAAFERLASLLPRGRAPVVTALVLVAVPVMAVRTAGNYRGQWMREPGTWLRHPTLDPRQLTPYSGVARWIEDNLAADATIALQEGGLIPFLTGRRTIETFGLCTPALARMRGVPRDRFGVRVDLTDGASPATAWVLAQRPDALLVLPVAPADPPPELHGGRYRLVHLMPLNQFGAGLPWKRNSTYRGAVYVRRDSPAFLERSFLGASLVAPTRVTDSGTGEAASTALAGGRWRVEGGHAWLEAGFEPPARLARLSLAAAGSLADPTGAEIVVTVEAGGARREVARVAGRNLGLTLDGTFEDAVGPLRLALLPTAEVSAVRVEVRGAAPLVVDRLAFAGP